MNIISPKNSTGAVSLKQLIPDHESLKLLILHTPFPLEIATLPQCSNLVKLDLSKNSIKAFPFLGNLKFLRIAFIHQNLLGINEFVKIFEREGERSVLNENIVWVTYWGNKNVFLARHYTVHKTKAIAFDKNIIVQQQRRTDLAQNLPVFCPESDITDIYAKKNYLNEYTTEEEYMQDFWITLKLLRRRYEEVNPIIKIQKVFRGWIFREKLRRQFQKQKDNYMLLFDCFKEWKSNRRKEQKLRRLLKNRKKIYLLYTCSKINREYIFNRMKELAQIARNNVLRRRLELENQIKFYSILRGNFKMLQELYQQLQIKQSPAIYIIKDNINAFVEYVVPFVKLFCSQDISHSLNDHYHLHFLHEPVGKHQKQFIKIIKTNRYSIVSSEKPLEKMLRLIRFRRPSVVDNTMKAIFGKVHISTEKREKMLKQERHLQQIKEQQRDQLLRIQGSPFLLKTIVRGIYFYNSKRLNLPPNHTPQRINIFSQMSLKRISSAVAIQRAWKGFIFRKKYQDQLKLILRFQKAATIIQRWFKRLPNARRKYFMFEVQSKLSEWEQSSFIVDFEDYYLKLRQTRRQNEKYVMLEQHVQVYKNKQTGELVVSWDDSTRRKEIQDMIKIGRRLFPSYFLAKIGLTSKEIAQKTAYSPDVLERCDIAHLFHYKTATSFMRQSGRSYLHIQCQSKVQARFRMLCIYLMCYDFKSKSSLDFYNKSDFPPNDLSRKALVANKQLSLICNENMSLIKSVEQNCKNIQDLSIYIIQNKIFLQVDINRQPFKVEERFIIYLINHEDKLERSTFPQPILPKQHSRYELSALNLSNASLLAPSIKQHHHHSHLIRSVKVQHPVPMMPLERKILVKKRSIKQFKAKIKRKPEQQPSFIIDNKSAQRITQNHSHLNLNSSHKITQGDDSSPKNSSQMSDIRSLMHARAKLQASTRRRQQDFTRRFINMGNFMQSQFANDHRKRIKTEMQHLAHLEAQEVRTSAHRSNSNKEERMNRKYMKAREMEQVHRSMVEHSRAMGLERSLLLRNNVEALRMKLKEEGKGSLRKPRVSFAEENFPILHRKPKNFSIN